jgi:hypothetical protein
MRLGGHNTGLAPVLLDDAMKAIKAATSKTTRGSAITSLVGGRRWGGEAPVSATGNHIFDRHNTRLLVSGRPAKRFLEAKPLKVRLR